MVSASTLVKEGVLPSPRFSPYLQEALCDEKAADCLYRWHARMSSACMELISHFEVILRNSIDSTLAKYYNESERNIPWFLLKNGLTKKIEKNIVEARQESARFKFESRGQIVSRLTFGFWTNMLSRRCDELWQKSLHNAFPNTRRPRSEVMRHVEEIRKFRNKVAHHDSLLGVNIPFEIDRIFNVTGWISTSAEKWLREISRCQDVYNSRPLNPLNTVIVPGKISWETYIKTSVYICQQGRFFRDVSRMAFYANKEIKPLVPEILERRGQVAWNEKEAQRLENTGNPMDKILSGAIKATKSMKDNNGELLYKDGVYQVFILSNEKNIQKTKKIKNPIRHTKTGKGSAYVRKQRYCNIGSLLHACTTDDIDSTVFS